MGSKRAFKGILVYLMSLLCAISCQISADFSKPHLLLTGEPGVGKTTIVKKVIDDLPCIGSGVYAEEERIDGKRVGFVVCTLDGKRDYLAHEEIQSPYRIASYGVNVSAIESLVIPALTTHDSMIIIDEIGLMQCCSPGFIDAVIHALDSSWCVFGTISSQNTEDFLTIKRREDVQIIEVTSENRDSLPGTILRHIQKMCR